jgi:hypothetical protein
MFGSYRTMGQARLWFGMAADPNSPVLNLESLELALEAAQLGEYEWHYGRRTFTVSPRI